MAAHSRLWHPQSAASGPRTSELLAKSKPNSPCPGGEDVFWEVAGAQRALAAEPGQGRGLAEGRRRPKNLLPV